MAAHKLTAIRVMPSKDSGRRQQQLLRLCSAFPPFLFACVALWFFAFLFHHSTRQLIQTSESVIVKQPSDQLKESGAHEDLGAFNLKQNSTPLEPERKDPTCDFSKGKWVRDRHRKPAYDESCGDIFKGWNCLRNNKSNAKDILAWRWQPLQCDMPQMNATLFLEFFKNKRIGFVGDSLNRNMYVSFVCSLKEASHKVRKWRPVGADKALTFLDYNLTVAYHRTNLLARYGQWKAKEAAGPLEKLGLLRGYRVDVDVPQSTWAEAPLFHDVLILNTGHWWWAPEKFDPVKTPMIFFEKGEPIIPTKPPEEGLDMVLKSMIAYVEQRMPAEGLMFLRMQSPRHFEGGDWNEGGSCHRSKPLTEEEAKTWFALSGKPGPNVEMSKANLHLEKAIQGTKFELLNISYLSSLRADAHPSLSAGKLHEDCMHWCLPGVTDIWNDMLVRRLLQLQQEASDNKI
ncbi:hypothetical protein GOP47_0015850 [Adiantum capillus-veneris]|uniref:Trichome birefringence-like N-terminal domain-containing protein n=1 Tax=Adiantum capillus-veneris TaxID=13818 RepID=A0A9D4ZC06_ADICA|nr:hypothetical protein GOP47_0015850 [Adiantum capillus-veneris]